MGLNPSPFPHLVAFLAQGFWLPPGRLTTVGTISRLFGIDHSDTLDSVEEIALRLKYVRGTRRISVHRIVFHRGEVPLWSQSYWRIGELREEGHRLIPGEFNQGLRIVRFVDHLAQLQIRFGPNGDVSHWPHINVKRMMRRYRKRLRDAAELSASATY